MRVARNSAAGIERPNPAPPIAAWRQSKWAALADNARKPNWGQIVEFLAWVECYAREYHLGSTFNQMLQACLHPLGTGEFDEPLDLYILWATKQTFRREKVLPDCPCHNHHGGYDTLPF